MVQLTRPVETREYERSWFRDLNPRQKEAVSHGDGPLLVVAGAGTGKTRTLAYRVSHLISQGVPPGRILLLTFTRRAASSAELARGHLLGLSSWWHRTTGRF